MSGLHYLRWSRVDPDLPPGIHFPKKHGDVGYDLEAMEDVTIPPMSVADIPVNAQIELPPNMWAAIRNRSSMGRRHLYVDQNVIDNGYRGRLFVLLRNMQLPNLKQGTWGGDWRYDRRSNCIEILAGERIGQLVFHTMTMVQLSEVPEIRTDTDRAGTGFGSTGK